MTNPTLTPSYLEKPRRRLIRVYRKLGTWRKVSQLLSDRANFEINPYYPYEFAMKGKVPANKRIQKALGISTPHVMTVEEVNRHLSNDTIQDMPTAVLAWALQHREEMG